MILKISNDFDKIFILLLVREKGVAVLSGFNEFDKNYNGIRYIIKF